MDKISATEFEEFVKQLNEKLFGKELDEITPEALNRVMNGVDAILAENNDLNIAIEYSVDNIHLADGQGNVLRVNSAFEKRVGSTKEAIEGKNVVELEQSGVYTPSVVNLVLKEKRKLTMIQVGEGGTVITTSTPVFDEKGNIIRVVSNARLIDELKLLNQYFQHMEKNGENFDSDANCNFQSTKMKAIIKQLNHIALVDSKVLFTGESGTGKSMLAKYIHQKSPRAKHKFIEINCAAIPENLIESELFGYETGAFTGAKGTGKPGLIELADKGTLFLDEIGDMPLNLQVKLLQVIQNNEIIRLGGQRPIPVDIRIISATNKNLEDMVEKGSFRLDLYYRLNVIPIHVPPLRERQEDILPLAHHFLNILNSKYNTNVSLSNEVCNVFIQYDWPGNIRELENLIERLVVSDHNGMITLEEIPYHMTNKIYNNVNTIIVNQVVPLKDALEEVEKQLVILACKEEKTSYEIGRMLGISQSGAHRRIQKYIK